jgi:protein-tyrosine phosphatase
MAPARAGVLVVCAANVCRSPMAALTLQRVLAEVAGFGDLGIASAGVSAGGQRRVCPEVAAYHDDPVWREAAASHRPRALEPGDVLDATLILTASRGIRSSVVSAVPERRDRVFTLREAVWLGTGFEPQLGASGDGVVEALRRHLDHGRGLRGAPAAPHRLPWWRRVDHPADIADGHQLRTGAHRRTVRAVDGAARELIALLAGPSRHAR